MRAWFEPARHLHERELLAALRRVMLSLGVKPAMSAQAADFSVVFGWDPLRPGQPTLYCECGWLPRWHFQLSWRGINAGSHLAGIDAPLQDGELEVAQERLGRLRQQLPPSRWPQFGYADPTGPQFTADARQFILVPLQVESDRNLRHAHRNGMQQLIDVVSAWDPPLPVVYRAHPSRSGEANAAVQLRRDQDSLMGVVESREVTVHRILKHPGCKLVVTLNSNVAHDALIWGVPVVALARGFWPEDGPFWGGGLLPGAWNGLMHYLDAEGVRRARLRHAAWVFRSQWRLADVRSDRIKTLLEEMR